MNKPLEYMIENRAKLVRQATKIVKSSLKAEDLIQDVMVKFLEKPRPDVIYPASFVWMVILNEYKNQFKRWDKRMMYSRKRNNKAEWQSENDYDVFEDLDEVCIENVEKAMDLEKLLDVYEKSCYPEQKRAIELFLKHETMEIPGENRSTLKTNRDYGINKLKVYLETGKFTGGRASILNSNQRKNKKRGSYVKTSTSS